MIQEGDQQSSELCSEWLAAGDKQGTHEFNINISLSFQQQRIGGQREEEFFSWILLWEGLAGHHIMWEDRVGGGWDGPSQAVSWSL
jgi:hypothetical protein